ncbi:endolytic transglycosylase MltG [Acidobacteriota bacterium]
MIKLIRWILIALILGGLIIAAVAGLIEYRKIVVPLSPPGREPVLVQIPEGASASKAARLLQKAGVIEDGELLLKVLVFNKKTESIQAGTYRFSEPVSVLDVARKILKGEVELVAVLVREGADRWEVADALRVAGITGHKDFLEIVRDTSFINDIDPKAPDLEGYLFPDTYYLSPHTDARTIVRIMTQRFKTKFKPEWAAEAESKGMTVREIVVLASIIEKETGDPSERSIISSVFHNRLNRRIQLASDPTIIYSLKLKGGFDGNLKRHHLKDPSPYNSYIQAGLPPGPIANPGTDSIRAALFPADTKYLYFVSMNNGKHKFSTNLKDHNAAVRKYQKEYWRNRWRKERGTK